MSDDLLSPDVRWAIAGVELVLFSLGALWLLFHRAALRDIGSEPRSYSWSRVQLWWWTVIILPLWILLWGPDGEFYQFNPTCLVLLGLSGTTTIAGRIIDDREQADPAVTPRTPAAQATASQITDSGAAAIAVPAARTNFFTDILSDQQGISIHRFQALVFNVAFAFAFVLDTFSPENWSKQSFPTFDPSTLALLGLSSITYVALKAKEYPPKAA